MTLQGPADHGTHVALVPARDDGYLLLGATVGNGARARNVRHRRRELMASIAPHVAAIAELPGVLEADLFKSQLVAPGLDRELLQRRSMKPADFDVVLLVRTDSPERAKALRKQPEYLALRSPLEVASARTYEIAARNARRINDVDHTRDSVFLFNFFFADDAETLLRVWEYTAQWFVDKTQLPDSAVLEPLAGEPSQYGIVNHASWPNYRTFLPHLALRPSFRKFVLATFESNNVAAQPILYRRVDTHPAGVRSQLDMS